MRPGKQHLPRSVLRRTAAALAGATLAIVPVVTSSAPSFPLAFALPGPEGLPGPVFPPLGPDLGVPPIGVDGSLPQRPAAAPLRVGTDPAEASGSLGIPASMLKAYRNAADLMSRERQSCRLDWALLASIGRIESNHARGGFVDANGNTRERILGPALNGTGGFAAIPSPDGGRFTGDPVWDHAIGAMQFITATWNRYASDGNGDSVSDPNNVYDETLAAARYLCSGSLDLSSDEDQRIAVRRYNNSQSYVATVMQWAGRYRSGASQSPDSTAPVGAPPGKPAESAPVAVAAPPAPATSAARPPVSAPNPPNGSAPATQLPATATPPSHSPNPTTSAPPTLTPACTLPQPDTASSTPGQTTAPAPPGSPAPESSPAPPTSTGALPVCPVPPAETTSSTTPAPL